MKYDVVMLEKEQIDGLDKEEVSELLNILNDGLFYPLELEARCVESSAMGFITCEAAETLDYDYENSGFHDFIANIMDNTENESSDFAYKFGPLSIYLGR